MDPLLLIVLLVLAVTVGLPLLRGAFRAALSLAMLGALLWVALAVVGVL